VSSNEFDVCVIGSAFGGGPAALRAAEAGASVVVLEQGKRWDGRGDSHEFRQVQGDFGYYMDLFDLYAGVNPTTLAASVVIGGKGLGGG